MLDLGIIYYVFTKMHDELLMFEYDVIWWIVDVWIRCYMMLFMIDELLYEYLW